jgi:uncharacterized protein with NAD-binding domain and iron-sulfur cluster
MTFEPSPPPGPATRIVILGGGPAGVAAAYWLSRPEQKGRYAITLYTQGWRLGGKCASGRNLDQGMGDRIEEHGLHMLMGCYENAFATMRACYRDWRAAKPDPENPFQTWRDAFLPLRQVSMMEQDGPGTPPSWAPWTIPFPQLPGEPGDRGEAPDGGEAMLLRMSDWLETYIPSTASYYESMTAALDAARGVLVSFVDDPGPALAKLRTASEIIGASIPDPDGPEADVTRVLRRLAILADLGIAMMTGYLVDIYARRTIAPPPANYDALDTQDFLAWLAGFGASSAALASAPSRAFYDLVFARPLGEASAPGSVAAGAALLAQLEMVLGYRDAPLWKMASGMGDTIFTPMYDVLRHSGVAVEFFSRVTALRASASGQLDEIDISVQAVTVDGAPYAPLTRVKGSDGKEQDCWPNQPLWSQLKNGAALEAAHVDFEYSGCTVSVEPSTVLKAGTDFDLAIVALPPASLAPLAEGLTSVDTPAGIAWQTALGSSRSVMTQSLQLWMKPSLASLGWPYGTTVLTSFVEPYDSWGDVSQVIPRESWPPDQTPGSIAYLCGCLPTPMGLPIGPHEMHLMAQGAADNWLKGNLRTLWPALQGDPIDGPDVLSRYDLANFDLSQRYVQTPAGDNVASRFSPAQPAAFGNLYAIGDWTKTRFSGGCFESAIESAMLASRAISGFPEYVKTL